jgi:hypothetical protein
MIDRIVGHADVLTLKGTSYRLAAEASTASQHRDARSGRLTKRPSFWSGSQTGPTAIHANDELAARE